MNNIEPRDAQSVLNAFGHGTSNDEFAEHLITTFMRADSGNFKRLASAYPGLAQAVSVIRHLEDGVSILKGIASPEAEAA